MATPFYSSCPGFTVKSKLSRGKKLLNIKNHTRPEVKISVSGGKIIEKSCPEDKRRNLSSIGGVQL